MHADRVAPWTVKQSTLAIGVQRAPTLQLATCMQSSRYAHHQCRVMGHELWMCLGDSVAFHLQTWSPEYRAENTLRSDNLASYFIQAYIFVAKTTLIRWFLPSICSVIKSPQYTGGDFMFLYRFLRRRRRRHRRRRRRLQILVHAITFEQLLGFLSFLAQLLALTCRLPDYIFVDFRRDLDLDFSRSNMEFPISQPKMVRLPRNEKQT